MAAMAAMYTRELLKKLIAAVQQYRSSRKPRVAITFPALFRLDTLSPFPGDQ
jgi:hypothetical protein